MPPSGAMLRYFGIAVHSARARWRQSHMRAGPSLRLPFRPMHATAVLGPICIALSIGFVWPQVVRLYRLDTFEVSAPNGTVQGLAACIVWAMYGAARGVCARVVSYTGIGGVR